MRVRKRWLGVVVFALFVAGCEPTVSSPPTSDPVLPPPDAITKTTPPPPVSTTTVAETPLQVQFYQGYLPDGTEYEIRIESNDTEEVEGIHAAIVLNTEATNPQLWASRCSLQEKARSQLLTPTASTECLQEAWLRSTSTTTFSVN